MQIFIVDDDQNIVDNLSFSLEKQGYKIRSAKSGAEALSIFPKHHFEIAFLDYALPDTNGIQLMAELKKMNPELICIFVTGSSDIGIAVEAVQKGAYDFIEKPFELDRIKVTLNKAKRELLQKQKINYLEKTIDEAKYDPIIGSHQSLKKILETLKQIASAQTFTVLIQGESGTGKELAAKYLHAHSTRQSQPFIAINCAAIPADLLESELFGHEKGSFSGAVETKIGLFEMANGGILFLDEIGDMPIETQVKLLRALETRTLRRVGGTKDIPFDIALVTATHKNLEDLITEKKFREDLFYRINIVKVEMPPLRNRLEDVSDLVHFYVKKFNQLLGKKITEVDGQAMKILETYHFPGNIRELKNTIERAMLLTNGKILLPDQFYHLASKLRPLTEAIKQTLSPVTVENKTIDYSLSFNDYKKSINDEAEINYFKGLLKETDGNVTLAAEKAGMQRTALSRLLSKHHISFKEFREK